MNKTIWILNHYATNQFFDRGGRHQSIGKYLIRNGYYVKIFCSNTFHSKEKKDVELDGNFFKELVGENDVPYCFVKSSQYSGNGKKRILNMISFYWNVKKVCKKKIRTGERPNIILASSAHPITLVAGLQLSKRYGIPCICEIRDLWPKSIVEYSNVLTDRNILIRLLYEGEKWIYKRADALIFTMEGALEYIVNQGWNKEIPSEKIFLINNGVDLEQFNCLKNNNVVDAELNDSNSFCVVYCGSVRQANRIDLLVEAAKKIEDDNIKILIWGSGSDVKKLEKVIKYNGVKNVFLKGEVSKSDIPSIVCRSSVNFLDYFEDGIGKYGISSNKLFEYFAANRPILINVSGDNIPGNGGSCEIIYEPTAEGIAEAIKKVESFSSAEYMEACENANRLAEIYSYELLTKKVMEVFESL